VLLRQPGLDVPEVAARRVFAPTLEDGTVKVELLATDGSAYRVRITRK
jgi:hypothetical protein